MRVRIFKERAARFEQPFLHADTVSYRVREKKKIIPIDKIGIVGYYMQL